jgi:hypothetical protein
MDLSLPYSSPIEQGTMRPEAAKSKRNGTRFGKLFARKAMLRRTFLPEPNNAIPVVLGILPILLKENTHQGSLRRGNLAVASFRRGMPQKRDNSTPLRKERSVVHLNTIGTSRTFDDTEFIKESACLIQPSENPEAQWEDPMQSISALVRQLGS